MPHSGVHFEIIGRYQPFWRGSENRQCCMKVVLDGGVIAENHVL